MRHTGRIKGKPPLIGLVVVFEFKEKYNNIHTKESRCSFFFLFRITDKRLIDMSLQLRLRVVRIHSKGKNNCRPIQQLRKSRESITGYLHPFDIQQSGHGHLIEQG